MTENLHDESHDDVKTEPDHGFDDAESSGRSAATRSLAVIAGLLVVGVLLNAMLWYISRPTQRGLTRHDDLNLSTLVVTEQRSLRLKFGFTAYLHDLARDGIITVPDAKAVDIATIENLSQMTVVVTDYDERITQDRIDGLSPGVEIAGLGLVVPGGEDVVYQFLMQDDSLAASLTYFVIADQVIVIDDRLLGP